MPRPPAHPIPPAPGPVAASTRTDAVFDALRAAIVRCEFAPGERLRVEELGERFDVSSSPLREALSRLVSLGLVDAFEHRGFRVAPITVAGMADLTRVRLLVEGEALRDAIANGDDTWEAALVASAYALSRAEQRLVDLAPTLDDAWTARHRAFHLSIYAGSSSPLLRALVEQLFDRAERYRRVSARHRTLPRRKNTEHQRLLEAVLARDADRAAELLVRHVTSTERSVTAALLAMDAAGLH
jgi:DNA-binding GntR family transcriptional regulator